MALTPKQNAFVAEYLKDLNATQAAIRAGYSARTAEKIGSENLQKPEIRGPIDEALSRRAERVEVKTDDVLRELLRLAMVDIGQAYDAAGHLKPLHEMPEDVRRAIAGLESRVDGEGATILKVKFWDKTRGLEMLGRHLKMFTDKVEHSGAVTIETTLAAARERTLRARMGAAKKT
jgi:phage terminase small subunit